MVVPWQVITAIIAPSLAMVGIGAALLRMSPPAFRGGRGWFLLAALWTMAGSAAAILGTSRSRPAVIVLLVIVVAIAALLIRGLRWVDSRERRNALDHQIIKRTTNDEEVCEEIKVLSGRLVEWFGKRIEGNEQVIDAAIRQLELDIGAVRSDQALTQAIRDFSHFCGLFLEDHAKLFGHQRVDRRKEVFGYYQALERERRRFLSGIDAESPPPPPDVALDFDSPGPFLLRTANADAYDVEFETLSTGRSVRDYSDARDPEPPKLPGRGIVTGAIVTLPTEAMFPVVPTIRTADNPRVITPTVRYTVIGPYRFESPLTIMNYLAEKFRQRQNDELRDLNEEAKVRGMTGPEYAQRLDTLNRPIEDKIIMRYADRPKRVTSRRSWRRVEILHYDPPTADKEARAYIRHEGEPHEIHH